METENLSSAGLGRLQPAGGRKRTDDGECDESHGKVERALLPLWALFIVLVGTFPLTNFVGHSHWEYIQWLPTADNFRSRRFLFDIVANMALFLPLGYLLDRSRSTTSARVHSSSLLVLHSYSR